MTIASERAPKKITRRLVLGTVAQRLDHLSAIFPRNVHSIAARIEGRKAASALSQLADVLRTLEDDGVEAAWEDLTVHGYGEVKEDD